jgi:hypothetical protein
MQVRDLGKQVAVLTQREKEQAQEKELAERRAKQTTEFV